MKKAITKLTAILFAIALLAGIVTPITVQAAEPTENARIEYNMPSGYIPFIYTYNEYGGLIGTLKNGATEVPYRSYSMTLYFSKQKVTVDTANSVFTVNGDPTTVTWSEDDYYQMAKISFPQGLEKRAVIKADFVYNESFGLKVRKIATGVDEAKLEPLLNKAPATYQISNDNGSIVINGSINTFKNNFVHWDATGTAATYVKPTADTVVWNLPNGVYTVKETYAGEGMRTDTSRASYFPYLNASSVKKDENGLFYYTFEVSNQYIKDFLAGGSSTNFFGFYTLPLPVQEKFNLTFDGNGGTGSMDAITNKLAGDAVKLPNHTFEKPSYDFIGWNSVANPTSENPGFTYQDGSNFTFGQVSEVLYAQWSKQKAVHHEVNVNDGLLEATIALDDLAKTLYKTNDLAYSATNFEEVANNYIADQKYTNAEYKGYTIEVKAQNSDTWSTYVEGMELNDETLVRYTLTIKAKAIEPVLPPVEPELPPVEPELPPVDPESPSVNPGEPDVPTNPADPAIPVIPPLISGNPITQIPFTPNTTVLPIAPVVTTPTEIVTPNETPLANPETETVKEKATPKAKNADGNGGSWAVINLIATALTLLMALIAIISKRNKEDEEQNADMNSTVTHERRGWLKVVTTLIAIASIILFVLTEDMSLPMEYIDEWTIWMVVIAVIQFMTVIVARKWKETDTKTVKVNN